MYITIAQRVGKWFYFELPHLAVILPDSNVHEVMTLCILNPLPHKPLSYPETINPGLLTRHDTLT